MGVEIVAHDTGLALRAGALRPLTKRLGLSLADRKRSNLNLGLDIRLIR